jgi:hypothetical protein
MGVLEKVMKLLAGAMESGNYFFNTPASEILSAFYEDDGKCERGVLVTKYGVEITVTKCGENKYSVFIDGVHRTFCGDCVC